MPFRTVARPPVGQVAYAPTALPAHRGGPQSGLLTKVGSFGSPTSSGLQSITGVGFRPKVILPFGVTATFSAGIESHAALAFGAAAGSVQGAIGTSSRTGQTLSSTFRSHYDLPLRNEGVSSSFPAMTAELESIDADGFTFDWTTVSGSVRYFNYACLGGSIEAKLVRCQMNNTNVAESFAHGLSGAPTAVILFSVLNEQPVPASRTTLYASIGAWAGGSQFSGSIWSNNGVTTTATRRILSTTKALVRVAGSIDRSLSIASVDGTNVNVTYPDTTAINQYYFWMLCIRGCRAKVGTFTLGGVLTPTEITCPGIRPKFFMPVLIPGGHVSPDAILSTMLMGVGASDGLATTSSGLTEVNNVTTTLSRRWQSNNNLDDYDSAGNLMIRSDISFGEESVIVDPTTNTSSTWGQGGYLILGDAA